MYLYVAVTSRLQAVHWPSVVVRTGSAGGRFWTSVTLKLHLAYGCLGTQNALQSGTATTIWLLKPTEKLHDTMVFSTSTGLYRYSTLYTDITLSYDVMWSMKCHGSTACLGFAVAVGDKVYTSACAFSSLSASYQYKNRITYWLQNASGMKTLRIICNRTSNTVTARNIQSYLFIILLQFKKAFW